MNGYTPSTDEVRDEYAQRFAQWGNKPSQWFDRWLAKVKADVWDEAVGSLVYDDGTPVQVSWNRNPYRIEDAA